MMPSLPVSMTAHTMSRNLVCGGSTCIQLSDGQWKTSHKLKYSRSHHVSWEVEGGVILMGGHGDGIKKTEFVQYDGGVEESFPLKNNVWTSCAINEGSSVVVTGGFYANRIVARYNRNGFVEYLPSLSGRGRNYHACGMYINGNNQKVRYPIQ